MNIDQNKLNLYATFNFSCNKRQKTCIFVMDYIWITQNHSFTKMRMEVWYVCNSYVI